MKKIIMILFVLVIISLLAFAFIPGFIDKMQSKIAAKGVLDNVIEQKYEKAFESIYYFDQASDLEPTIPYEDAKEKWIQRVTELKENGVILLIIINYTFV